MAIVNPLASFSLMRGKTESTKERRVSRNRQGSQSEHALLGQGGND